MNTEYLLAELCSACGVSGDEAPVIKKTSELLKKYAGLDSVVSGGNLTVSIGERCEGKKHILVDAHIDEIGMIVSYIDEDGFIVPGNIGGMDYRILPAQKVTVHGKEEIFGVISTVPPHLTSGSSVMKNMDYIRIDTGYSREELEKYVSPGDTVSFFAPFARLSGSGVTGKSLDNRAGAAALVLLAEMIRNDNLQGCSVTLLISSSEEIGERGAKTACYEINPDIALVIDTSFALTPDDSPKKCGLMGKGPMIGISPSLSREITDGLMETAAVCGIPYQTEVMSGLTGTNADQFSVSRCGVKTCTVSVPIRHMHTPAETADLTDIENTAGLIAEYIRRVK